MKRKSLIGQAFTVAFILLTVQAYCQVYQASHYTAVTHSNPTIRTVVLPSNTSTAVSAIQAVHLTSGSTNNATAPTQEVSNKVSQRAISASDKKPGKFKWFGHYILVKLAGKFNE